MFGWMYMTEGRHRRILLLLLLLMQPSYSSIMVFVFGGDKIPDTVPRIVTPMPRPDFLFAAEHERLNSTVMAFFTQPLCLLMSIATSHLPAIYV
jgi:hypothetical protein